MEFGHRADLVAAGAGIGLGELFRRVEGGLQGGAVDDVEAEELLLGLREGPVDHQFLAPLAQGRGRRRRQQAGHRPQPSLPGELVVHRVEPCHGLVVMVLGPCADGFL